ncbi:MAG: ATP-dependent DNA helicase RecG, partial [Vicinamibacteraceae bacterium]|nr:ATP-dependent DNA helicase RecG [Vicinamibacteraceae bacterium]
MALALDAPLSTLKGVGPRRVAEFARVGVHCLEDLLTRFPLRYEDRSHLAPISAIRPGAPATVMGTIASCRLRLTRRRGFTIFEAVVRDEAGATLTAVWFNQRFLRDVFSRGQHVVLFGPARAGRSGGLELQNPQYELLGREGEDGDEPGPAEPGADTELLHTGRIVPIYERVGAVTPRVQRWLVREALAALPDPLDDPIPPGVLAQTGWPSRREALVAAHFPPPGADLDALNGFRSPAQQRLIFEEFYLFQLGVLLRRRAGAAERKPFSVTVTDTIRARARAVLPFTLTPGQRTALKEIVDDMVQSRPMHRLLQGDVGAGKTIVAVLAALVALENGLQVAFMAPTEILAEQHLASLARWLAPTRYVPALLTGRVPAARRRTIRADLANGRVRLVVGTHALVQEDVAFNRLGLAVIDEQHRFGVVQRAALSAKGLVPDVLVMTATPIPRTLALTAYGDLDVSVIRDRPPGRTPVRTLAKPESRRDEIYELLRAELRAGRQAYVVYPLIDESEKVDLRA